MNGMFDQTAMRELLDAFIAEFDEALGVAEQALLALEREPQDADSIASVFRVVHTIKGNAGIFEFTAVTTFAHAMEDLLDGMRRGRIAATPSLVTLLLRSLDVLRTMLCDSVAGPRQISAAERELIREISAAGRESSFETTPLENGPTESRCSVGDLREPASSSPAEPNAASRDSKRTLRVDVSRLDRLLDLSGEIGIARGRVTQLLTDPRTPRAVALEAHRDSMLLQMEMQELIMKLRMVPVGTTFRQLLRTVRDTARTLGKTADLRIEGEEVEVDMTVIEQLKDPLIHMVRNSVDHGIETPDVRARAGKQPSGTLVLRSFHEAGSIVIELEDDGAGLDRERILQRARSRGLVEPGELLSDEELLDLVFSPGFSTAERVSDVSGRGVGLDIVRRNIEAIHGSVSIDSVAGSGTTVTIRLPLTLAIIDGLQVGVADESYIIPMEAVVEALDLGGDARHNAEATGLMAWRGADIPYIRLRRRLAVEAATPGGSREHVVVVRYGDDGRAALIVDELYGECQTVVKPLAKFLQGITGISGSAILPDGKIAFIVDVPDLLQSEIVRTRKRRTESTALLALRADLPATPVTLN